MKTMLVISTLLLVLSACNKRDHRPMFAKDMSNEKERNNNLIVFVGEKTGFKKLETKPEIIGFRYSAKYKLLENIYGKFDGDNIEISDTAEMDQPDFPDYPCSLIFMQKRTDGSFHVRLNLPIYKTSSGGWAAPYMMESFSFSIPNKIAVPHKVDFEKNLIYEIDTANKSVTEINYRFPSPYYKIEGDKAYAVYGWNLTDLFEMAKAWDLSDLFKKIDLAPFPEVEQREMAEVSANEHQKNPVDTSVNFLAFWQIYKAAIMNRDYELLKKLSVKNCHLKWSDSSRWQAKEISTEDFFKGVASEEERNPKIIIPLPWDDEHHVNLIAKDSKRNIWLHFIETMNGYKLVRANSSNSQRRN